MSEAFGLAAPGFSLVKMRGDWGEPFQFNGLPARGKAVRSNRFGVVIALSNRAKPIHNAKEYGALAPFSAPRTGSAAALRRVEITRGPLVGACRAEVPQVLRLLPPMRSHCGMVRSAVDARCIRRARPVGRAQPARFCGSATG